MDWNHWKTKMVMGFIACDPFGRHVTWLVRQSYTRMYASPYVALAARLGYEAVRL